MTLYLMLSVCFSIYYLSLRRKRESIKNQCVQLMIYFRQMNFVSSSISNHTPANQLKISALVLRRAIRLPGCIAWAYYEPIRKLSRPAFCLTKGQYNDIFSYAISPDWLSAFGYGYRPAADRSQCWRVKWREQ